MNRHPDSETEKEIWENMRQRLMQLTMKQLKQLAKDEQITLGYSSSRKDSLVGEIIAQRRHRAQERDVDPSIHPWREWHNIIPKKQQRR
jgi:transposase